MTKQELIDLGFYDPRKKVRHLIHRLQPFYKDGLNAYELKDDNWYVKYSDHDCFFSFDPEQVKSIIESEEKTSKSKAWQRPATLTEQQLLDVGFKKVQHKEKGMIYQYKVSCRINKDNQDLIKHCKGIERIDPKDEQDVDLVMTASNNKYINQDWYEISTPYGSLRNLEDLLYYLTTLGYAPNHKPKKNNLSTQKTETMSDLFITGKVHQISNIMKINEKLEKQEIVVHTVDDKYPQFIKFETLNPSILDGLKVGDEVKVNFNIRGNEWKEKFYVSLNCWRVEILSTAEQPIETKTESLEAVDDGLPF